MSTEFFLAQRFPDGPRREWVLQEGPHAVGRSSDCDIVIDEKTISREHASIHTEADAVRVVDLGSMNGTFINNDRITTMQLAPVGCRLRFGRVECVVANTQTLNEFFGSEFSTQRYVPTSLIRAHEQLPEAQKPVFDGLLDGLAEKEIAFRLDRSRHTVHHHIDAIHRVFNVASSKELLALFVHK